MIESIRNFYNFIGTGLFSFYDQNVGRTVLVCIGCAVLAYLCGSINCGLLISKAKYGQDIRTQGSGNAGTTNMMRVYGKKAGVLTFIGDILKTAVAVVIGYILLGYYGAYFAGLFCIIGHAFPIFFKFKGGKGVATIATVCLLTEPVVFLIMLLIFVIILFGYKMVSLASVMIMLIYPMMLSMVGFAGPAGLHIILAAIMALFVIFLHRKNIVRIYNHTESKISIGKNKKNKKSYKEDDENENSQK